jgi:hypothetical protein
MKITPVEETKLGMYVWEMPDGRWIGDDAGNYLCVASFKGDPRRIASLTNAVREYGVHVGKPIFLAGRRPIDDEEYEYQKKRLEFGLTPDPLDIGDYKDSLKGIRLDD